MIAVAAVCGSVTAACTTSSSPSSSSASHSSDAATGVSDPDHLKTLAAVVQGLEQSAPSDEQVGGPLGGGYLDPVDVLHYGVDELWKRGIDGTGTTIAVIEAWNDPNLDARVSEFDQRIGLPPADIETIYPSGAGRLPAQCPAGMLALGDAGSCDAWAGEIELDVESVHLIAPYAKILVAVTPPDSEITDDTAMQGNPPEMMQGLEYIAAHHLADAVSISAAIAEQAFSHGKLEITAQDPGELAAAAAGIPVTVGTGDCGPVQVAATSTSQCGQVGGGPQTAVWSDSPWITAVGGSVPGGAAGTAVAGGTDPVWSQGTFSGGAGVSTVYPKPAYQDAVVGGAMRQVPDITMDARVGTSEATPLVAAVFDLAAQLAHGPIGPVNPLLYQMLGPHGAADGIADVTTGSDSVPGHTGYPAGPGFDEATGWGTLNASVFVPALAAAFQAQPQGGADSARAQAAAGLAALEKNARVAPADLASGASGRLAAGGFLPGHPVRIAIDGRQIATVAADGSGAISYALRPATLKLAPGRHSVTLVSMLITEQAVFHSA